MTALAANLDTAIAGAVADANVAGVNATYVSELDALAGHELCTRDSWVYRVSAKSVGTTNYQYQGHPTALGQQEMAARVTAALSRAPLSITSSEPPTFSPGAAVNFSLAAAGGTPPYSFGVTSALPAWVSSFSAGTLTGAITEGTWPISFQVQDSTGRTATRTYTFTATAEPGATPLSQIAAGGSHSCALLSTGGVKCWGGNGYGQLGNGTTTNSSPPVAVSGIP